MEYNNSFNNSLKNNYNSENNLSKNNYENKNESSKISYDKISIGDNNMIIKNDQSEKHFNIDNRPRIINNNFSNVSSIRNNDSNFNFNSNNFVSLNNNSLSNNEIDEKQFMSNSNYNLKDYNINEKLNITKEEMPLKISNIIDNSDILFQNNNDQDLNNAKLNENKNEEQDLNNIFSSGYEIITNLTNKINNYQNLIENSINEEYLLTKSQILIESDINNVNNTINYQLGNYLKFRDKFKLTYKDPELFIESNCFCIYCEKKIFGYIYEIEILEQKIFYCSECFNKIIDKIEGPLKIYIHKPSKELNQDYKSKITQIKINDKIYDNNIILFNYKNVPSLLNFKLTIENNGNKKWPSDSIIDINNYCDKNFFFIDIEHTEISLDIGKSYDFEFEFNDLNKLTPGKYSLVLCVKYSNKKKMFGNIDDMIITFLISI